MIVVQDILSTILVIRTLLSDKQSACYATFIMNTTQSLQYNPEYPAYSEHAFILIYMLLNVSRK